MVNYYWLNLNSDYYNWSFSTMKVGDREDYSSLNQDGGKRYNPNCFKSIEIGDKVIAYETVNTSITAICKVISKKNIEDEIIVLFEKSMGFDKYLSLAEMKKSRLMGEIPIVKNHRGTLLQLEEKHFNELVRTLEAINNPEEEFYKKVQELRNISSKERKRILAEKVDRVPEFREVTRNEYIRDHYVVVEVLERANGICEKCNRTAPFNRKDGTPYLEVHHEIWLKNGGEDTIENAIAVCPNCHRALHFGE